MRWNPQRLDRLEGIARKRRQADAPAVVLVVPDDEFHVIRNPEKITNLMVQSQAAAYADELTRSGQRLPCFVHFNGQDMNC